MFWIIIMLQRISILLFLYIYAVTQYLVLFNLACLIFYDGNSLNNRFFAVEEFFKRIQNKSQAADKMINLYVPSSHNQEKKLARCRQRLFITVELEEICYTLYLSFCLKIVASKWKSRSKIISILFQYNNFRVI